MCNLNFWLKNKLEISDCVTQVILLTKIVGKNLNKRFGKSTLYKKP